jgi:hypothetical protein
MSKRTWDTGVMKVIKKERNQAIALAMGRKCRKNIGVADSFEVLHSNRWGVPVQMRWCIGTVHQIYLVTNYLIIEVTLFCLECSIYRYKFIYSNSCTSPLNTYHVIFPEKSLALHCMD